LLKRLFIGALIAIVIGYSLFMGLYFYTSEPAFCSKCHYIEPVYFSWQDSAHNEVKCLFCHEPRGSLGKFHSKARGLNYLFLHYSGSNLPPLKGEIYESNCIICHLGKQEKYPDAVKITNNSIEHYKIINEDRSCLDCHKTIGHELNTLNSQFELSNN